MLLDSILARFMFPFMLEDAGGGGGGNADGGTDPAAGGGGGDDGTADPDPDDTEEHDDAGTDGKDAQALLTKLRTNEKNLLKANKALKTELDAFKADQKKRDDADKTELEKAQARVLELENASAELQTKLNERTLAHAIEAEAAKPQFTVGDDKEKTFRFREPEVARNLVMADDELFALLEYDEETGKAAGVKKALKELAKKDYLLDGDDGAKGPARSTPRPDDHRETKLTPEAIKDLAVDKVLDTPTSF
jgi:hypothetical protein